MIVRGHISRKLRQFRTARYGFRLKLSYEANQVAPFILCRVYYVLMHINFRAHPKGKLTLRHNKTYGMNTIALPWYYFHPHLDKDDISCARRNVVTLSNGIRHFDICVCNSAYFFYIRNLR